MTSRKVLTELRTICVGSEVAPFCAGAHRYQPEALHKVPPTSAAPSVMRIGLESDPRAGEPEWHGQWQILRYL